MSDTIFVVIMIIFFFIRGSSVHSFTLGWQGSVTFHDVLDNAHDRGVAQIRLEGVYIWPFRQLRMVANRCIFNFIFFVLRSFVIRFYVMPSCFWIILCSVNFVQENYIINMFYCQALQ